MDITTISKLISTLGFPIAAVICMGYFVSVLVKRIMEQNKENMAQVLNDCKEREEKLYKEIQENREINRKAIETIAKYSEKLDAIQNDIDGIKTDMVVITTKLK